MGTTAQKLLYLQGTKEAIHDAIVAKGVAIPTGTAFRDYSTKIGNIISENTPTADIYVRPTEWLPIPDNINGVEKVSILNAIFNTDSEFVALICTGAYTVDWGDGTSNNYATGIKAEHKYDYSNANLNTDTVTKFGYKQCIITITPQSEQNLTKVDLTTYHSSIGSGSISYITQSGFLDINVNVPFGNTDAIRIGYFGATYVKHTLLEKVKIGQVSASFISMDYQFYRCSSLQLIEFGFSTIQITSWRSTFSSCVKLQKLPAITFYTSNYVSYDNMCQDCVTLVEIPEFNIVSNQVSGMFTNCSNLEEVVLNITSTVNLSFQSTFSGCAKLSKVTITLTGGGKITSLSSAFNGCRSLKVLPVLDTSACSTFLNAFTNTGITILPSYSYLVATTLASMCTNCYSLIIVPNIVISSSCTNISSAFSGCSSLSIAPNITGGTNITTANSLYSLCYSLVNVPSYSFPSIVTTGIAAMFNSCNQLASLPSMNFGTTYTSTSNFCSSAYALKRMVVPLRFSFSVANAKMSSSALDEMYTALPTVTGQTVTVTGNYGVSADTPSIATAKGWTVTG